MLLEASRMVSVKANVIANFAGRATTGLLMLVVTPIYVRLLGIEAYGLIGMFAAIQGTFGIMDLGLGTTLNQRLARLTASTRTNSCQEMRDLVRTFEVPYALLGLLSGAILVTSAPWTARNLLHASALPQSTVDNSVRLMGITLALHWPVSLYSGALAGTQRQVLLNWLRVSLALLRSLGAIATLLFFSRTVAAFFWWQVLVAGISSIAFHVATWRVLPSGHGSPRFRRDLLVESLRFAGHLTGSSLLAMFITQIDKFLLGHWLPLAELGYYTLATTVGNALNSLIGPVFTATFPRLSQLASASQTDDVRLLYHKACQLMSLMLFPPALVASLFSYQLLLAWTGSGETAMHVQRLVPWLVLGTTFNGLVNMPYALELAYGWSQFPFVQNVISAILLGPLTFVLVHAWGALGGALGWFTLNAGYVFIAVPAMHRRLLHGDYLRWLLRDVGSPFLATLAVVGTARLLLQELGGQVEVFAVLSIVGLTALLAATAATLYGRQTLRVLAQVMRSRLASATAE
ncbi:MAG: oligosaccharide flippase family protein [Deltaproteobacteria bacterium]